MDGFYQYIYICMIINIMDGFFLFFFNPLPRGPLLMSAILPPNISMYKYVYVCM